MPIFMIRSIIIWAETQGCKVFFHKIAPPPYGLPANRLFEESNAETPSPKNLSWIIFREDNSNLASQVSCKNKMSNCSLYSLFLFHLYSRSNWEGYQGCTHVGVPPLGTSKARYFQGFFRQITWFASLKSVVMLKWPSPLKATVIYFYS